MSYLFSKTYFKKSELTEADHTAVFVDIDVAYQILAVDGDAYFLKSLWKVLIKIIKLAVSKLLKMIKLKLSLNIINFGYTNWDSVSSFVISE